MNPVRFKGTVVYWSHSGAAPLRRSVLGRAVVLVPECLLQLGTVSPSGEQPRGAVTARLKAWSAGRGRCDGNKNARAASSTRATHTGITYLDMCISSRTSFLSKTPQSQRSNYKNCIGYRILINVPCKWKSCFSRCFSLLVADIFLEFDCCFLFVVNIFSQSTLITFCFLRLDGL